MLTQAQLRVSMDMTCWGQVIRVGCCSWRGDPVIPSGTGAAAAAPLQVLDRTPLLSLWRLLLS